jgi:hypothetical protein
MSSGSIRDMNKGQWVHGIVAAFIGGVAGALDSGLALLLIAPETFNLNTGLRKTLLTLTVFGLLSGAKLAFAYLKTAPTPWTSETSQESHTKQVEDGKVVQRDSIEVVKTAPAPEPKP